MDYATESLRLHGEWKGKIEVVSRVPVNNKDQLSLAYTPGVAQPCLEIQKDMDKSYELTRRHNLVAVITDGTAIVVGAAILNALRVVDKRIDEIKMVVNGAGSAGIAIGKHLMNLGVKHLKMVDRCGILCEGADMNPAQAQMAAVTNPERFSGTLADALRGADVFVGVSAPHTVSQDMIRSMAKDAVVFPMANPVPEIEPEEAKAAGAAIVGTGRSDHPNQINNVLVFPGLFRGALDVRAREINEEMKLAASHALAGLVTAEELNKDYILPKAFDKRVGPTVAAATAAWPGSKTKKACRAVQTAAGQASVYSPIRLTAINGKGYNTVKLNTAVGAFAAIGGKG